MLLEDGWMFECLLLRSGRMNVGGHLLTFWNDPAPHERKDEFRVFPYEAEVERELEGSHPDACL